MKDRIADVQRINPEPLHDLPITPQQPPTHLEHIMEAPDIDALKDIEYALASLAIEIIDVLKDGFQPLADGTKIVLNGDVHQAAGSLALNVQEAVGEIRDGITVVEALMLIDEGNQQTQRVFAVLAKESEALGKVTSTLGTFVRALIAALADGKLTAQEGYDLIKQVASNLGINFDEEGVRLVKA